MNRQIGFALFGAAVLLVGLAGTAAAQPGDGPPDDLPSPVPDFVTDLLGAIGDFLGGAVDVLGDVLRTITPGGGGGAAAGGPGE
ncbi:hypothetical protein G9464_04145 [Halostella sp. JP-L12]|uniref:hypothetical protein n=1 Tax=Halostella TaxID=1843185 RepID=UPI000EF78472|nr:MULTISPECIES: hypothetical protein [Halostella]NHN46787.1 hypothetical protein [Halostella sp. JP-L12]